jgi:delta14-sterol reductase
MSIDLHSLLVGSLLCVGFLVLMFVLTLVVPGKLQQGAVLADGTRRTYKLNGLAILIVTMLLLGAGQALHLFSLSIIEDNFLGLFIAANIVSFAGTIWLWARGRNAPDAGKHGSALLDMWYGVTLNPELLGVDLKMWAYRPSLIGLAVINASFAVVQWERDGELSTAMILYQCFTAIYVFNYFQFEYGMLYTWDIVAEKFGFMLVWGDLAFVPFAYSVVGWYLLDRTEPLSMAATIALPIMFVTGLWIFRGANQQKDEFKRDPSVKIWGKQAQTLGGRILVSGFWGIGRKLNYTGEILVYWSFTLLSGTTSLIPYLLPMWLLALLTHRAWRDDKKCREKYGALWDEYCRKATFKMIPFVY